MVLESPKNYVDLKPNLLITVYSITGQEDMVTDSTQNFQNRYFKKVKPKYSDLCIEIKVRGSHQMPARCIFPYIINFMINNELYVKLF